jgi:hypothetical protein
VKRFFISIITLAILTGSGLFIRHIFDQRARAAKLESEILKSLSGQEISEILKSEAASDYRAIEGLNDHSEKRELFLKGLRETLALAAQARLEGFADDKTFKINLEYKKKILLADLYVLKLSAGKDRLYVVPPEQIEDIWKDSANEQFFQRDMNVLREIRSAAEKIKGNTNPIPTLAGDALKKSRGKWARTIILSKMAQEDREFFNQPAISLRMKVLEAGILANDYLRERLQKKINARDEEIKEYLQNHPEYDVRKKLGKAEMVLARAKAGENFAALVKEYSEDRATNALGGLYKDVKANVLWKEVEEAALELKPGEIADRLIESNLGFHIVKLIKKNKSRKADRSDLEFSVRHIVLQKHFEEPGKKIPGIPKPFLTPQEIAKAEVEKAKREKFISEIIRQNPISLPSDFKVVLPRTEQDSKEKPKGE